jgi:hypothetical protein
LCFADGTWWASEIAAWVATNLKPCRIEYFADCCHAESNWRAIGEVVTFGWVDNPRGPVAIRLDAPRGWGGQMIQWAGCRQNSWSYGDKDGGTWTQTLEEVLTWKKACTRIELFDEGIARMPADQEPVWTTHNANSNFIDGIVFE